MKSTTLTVLAALLDMTLASVRHPPAATAVRVTVDAIAAALHYPGCLNCPATARTP